MGIFRRNINRVSRAALAATLVSVLTASAVAAQSTEGNWGAEGRIGSGQSAYLLRWFSPSWSAVLGGGFSSTSSETPANNSKNDNRSVSVLALVRKEWGASRVHPFVGFGPTVSATHTVNKTPTGGGITETTGDNNGFGGRFEFGAFASINQSVGLGLVGSATGQHSEAKSKTSGSSVVNKSTSNSFGFGNPQFAIRVRF